MNAKNLQIAKTKSTPDRPSGLCPKDSASYFTGTFSAMIVSLFTIARK